MKILLTNFHDGDGGGHTTYLMALARGLRDRHEIHIAAPSSSRLYREAATVEGVRAVAQPFPNGLGKLAAASQARRQLRAFLRQHAFDIVHVNGSADHRLVLAAQRGAGKKPKIVLTKHNSKPITGIGHRWRARRTDLVIAVSDYTRRMLEASAYAGCRISTVCNGVDIAHFRPWPVEAAAAERFRHADGATLLLGSNAGTADHKGWIDLIEAIAMLDDDAKRRVRVLLCGKPLSSAQQARLEALGLRDTVRHAGMLGDVRPMIAAIDVGFVLSYATETISFACREMMAMGKPVLVSDYAGLPENIEPGVDSWCVPVRDRAAIVQAVSTMLADPAQFAWMGERARARAERDFGLDLFVSRTEAAYARALSV
jgi:glycosyltransferase involved in cell wall biosynthesis